MEIFPSRYVGVFSLLDNNNNGFATTHPTCNFSVQSRKLNQWGEKKGFTEKGKWITPELCMRINHLHYRVQFMPRITPFFKQYGTNALCSWKFLYPDSTPYSISLSNYRTQRRRRWTKAVHKQSKTDKKQHIKTTFSILPKSI